MYSQIILRLFQIPHLLKSPGEQELEEAVSKLKKKTFLIIMILKESQNSRSSNC